MINNLLEREQKFILISKSKIFHNLNYLQKCLPSHKLIACVKANAYGLGYKEIVDCLQNTKVKLLTTASLVEANNIVINTKNKLPILILYSFDESDLHNCCNFELIQFSVYSLQSFSILKKFAVENNQNVDIQLNLNTGMNWFGLNIKELAFVLEDIKSYPNLRIKGVWSHLATSDNLENNYFEIQNQEFLQGLDLFKRKKLELEWIHINNSCGLFRKNNIGNSSRIGISLYGMCALDRSKQLTSVFEYKSKIVEIKKLNAREKLGYSNNYVSNKDELIGILPVGYSDGLPRSLSNAGRVIIDNNFCQIVGNICMNITFVRLTDLNFNNISELFEKEVVLIGSHGNTKIYVEEWSESAKTIPYEILTKITANINRKIID
jgi:alanine racemase